MISVFSCRVNEKKGSVLFVHEYTCWELSYMQEAPHAWDVAAQ
jgi:hypothetical protein